MTARYIVLLGLAAALAGCAFAPASPADQGAWNDGIWNSVLGYHGPASAMVVGGPAR
jgi:hypothetical protein